MTTDFDGEQIVRDVTLALRKKHPDHSEAEVEAAVRDELAALEGRPVQDYLSVLTERAVRQRFKRASREK